MARASGCDISLRSRVRLRRRLPLRPNRQTYITPQTNKTRAIWLGVTVCLWLWLSCTPAHAAQPGEPAITLRFVGASSLARLAAGEPGEGWLLFLRDSAATRPALVLHLQRADDHSPAIAELFDAPPNLDYLPIRLVGETVLIDTLYRPTVVMSAADGWWAHGEQVNYNLDMTVFGQVGAMWGAGDPRDLKGPGWVGAVSWEEPTVRISVRDPAGSGLPQWELRQLLPEFPQRGYIRTSYAEQHCATPRVVSRGVVPDWPFVAAEDSFEQLPGAFHPPIVVDWASGRIVHVAELVTVRHQNCSYALYSLNALTPGARNQLDFETPFAFYDLTGEGRGYPNLIVRSERYPAHDPWSVGIEPQSQHGHPVPREIEWIRYSWRNAQGDGSWDYKVELLGFQHYNSDTPIADGLATIDAPGYAELPGWVLGQPWAVATFVAAEKLPVVSSEGIYDWSPRDVGIGYLLGFTEQQPTRPFETISPGLRGEFRAAGDAPVRLYQSPLDNRLHLLGASAGVLAIDATHNLRLRNLDGDAYLDGWVSEQIDAAGQTTATEQLYALAGYLIYVGPQGIELRQAAPTNAAFELAPPSDAASWRDLRARLAIAGPAAAPDNLAAWLQRFPGPTLQLPGATLDALRATTDGFRMEIELPPAAIAAPRGALLDLHGLTPGGYVLNYDGALKIVPLTPVAVSATIQVPTIVALAPQALPLTLRNTGGRDVSAAQLSLEAIDSDGQLHSVLTRTLDLPAAGTSELQAMWVAPRAGTCRLRLSLHDIAGQTIVAQELNVDVAAALAAAPTAVLAASADPATLTPAMLALFTLASIAALIAALAGHSRSRG